MQFHFKWGFQLQCHLFYVLRSTGKFCSSNTSINSFRSLTFLPRLIFVSIIFRHCLHKCVLYYLRPYLNGHRECAPFITRRCSSQHSTEIGCVFNITLYRTDLMLHINCAPPAKMIVLRISNCVILLRRMPGDNLRFNDLMIFEKNNVKDKKHLMLW